MKCASCNIDKPASDYYASRSNSSGLMGSCKECVKARVRERARTNPAVQAYDRERAKRPHIKARIRKVVTKWREDNPLAYKAQTAVGNAIRDGRLVRQPCEVCGGERVHAHHDDYAKPLDVRWLCALHHHRHHAASPEHEGKNKVGAEA